MCTSLPWLLNELQLFPLWREVQQQIVPEWAVLLPMSGPFTFHLFIFFFFSFSPFPIIITCLALLERLFCKESVCKTVSIAILSASSVFPVVYSLMAYSSIISLLCHFTPTYNRCGSYPFHPNKVHYTLGIYPLWVSMCVSLTVYFGHATNL